MRDQDERGPRGAANPPPPGSGAAKGTGYGAGGLGAGADRALGRRPDPFDAPGVAPSGERVPPAVPPDSPGLARAADNPEDQPPARE